MIKPGTKIPVIYLRCIHGVLYCLMLLQFCRLNAQNAEINKTFTLKGYIKGMDGKHIYFSFRGLGNERIWDSSIIKQGHFIFTGPLPEPVRAILTSLRVNRNSTTDPNATPLFIEPTSMNIILKKNHFRNAKLIGSKSHDEFMQLENSKNKVRMQRDPLQSTLDELNEEFERNNTSAGRDSLSGLIKKINVINDKIALLNKKEFSIDKLFYLHHPGSYITAYKLADEIRHFTLQELKFYYKRMPPAVQQSEHGIEIEQSIAKMSLGTPGTLATNFTAKEINGGDVSLSDFRGKYLLLDFWASWCKPCRQGNPELKRLYLTYNIKGVEFLGIASDDKTVDKWKEAVATDGIGIWKQVLEGDIRNQYHIQSYPTKILVDPNGKIIARYSEEDGEPEENLPLRLIKLFGK